MKLIIKILSVIMLVSFSSCDSILDTKPEDFLTPDQYYNNKQDMEVAITGLYVVLRDNALYKNHMLGRLGLDADEGYDRNSLDGNSVGDYNVSVADVKVASFWQILYNGIEKANVLLANINKPQDLTDDERARIEGEALFLRAYFYFLLVRNYGDVPLILEPTKSVSIREHQVERTPALDVYNQIIRDMEKAEKSVCDISDVGHSGRVTKSAVRAILTRVCLHAAGNPVNDKDRYKDVVKWADLLIEDPEHELNPNFQEVFTNYANDIYDIKESIWEVEFAGDGTGVYGPSIGGLVGGNNGIFCSDEVIGYSYSYICVTAYTYNVYDAGDLRRDWTVSPFIYSGNPATKIERKPTEIMSRYCGKFRRESELGDKGRTYTRQNFPIIRYSDVLLMFAEAENEINLGPTPEAYDAINEVRRRGYGFDVKTPNSICDLTGLDYTGFLTEIQKERTRELAFETLRKGDLVRWGIFLPKMKQRLAEAESHSEFYDLRFAKRAFTSVSARDVVWPIPAYDMALNRKLKQNTGW